MRLKRALCVPPPRPRGRGHSGNWEWRLGQRAEATRASGPVANVSDGNPGSDDSIRGKTYIPGEIAYLAQTALSLHPDPDPDPYALDPVLFNPSPSPEPSVSANWGGLGTGSARPESALGIEPRGPGPALGRGYPGGLERGRPHTEGDLCAARGAKAQPVTGGLPQLHARHAGPESERVKIGPHARHIVVRRLDSHELDKLN